MSAWTINSLTAPVTRGSALGSDAPKPAAPTSTAITPPAQSGMLNLLEQILGPNWQSLLGTQDRSGLVGGGSQGPTAEDIYSRSAANLMNAKSYAIGQAYNPWVLNKIREDQNRLVSGGAGMGLSSGGASQYNTLQTQLADQMGLMNQWNRTAQAAASSPIYTYSLQPKTSAIAPPTGWGFGQRM